MKIKPISRQELGVFAGLNNSPRAAAAFERFIQYWWELGEGRPEWCFLAYEAGLPVGRIGFLGSGSEVRLAEMFGLSLPWNRWAPGGGQELLQYGLEQMARAGCEHVICRVFGYQQDRKARLRFLEAAGFRLLQERVAYWWPDPWPPLPVPGRLRFRSRSDVGEAAFIDAFVRVSQRSLDRVDQLKIRVYGPAEHARQFYDLLKSLNHHAEWWQLAYTEQGALVGLVAPVLLRPKEGSIGYIGVVPEQRGRGYVNDLLTRGLAILQSRGLDDIACETDRQNFPMRRAFEQIGQFREDDSSRVWVYHLQLG